METANINTEPDYSQLPSDLENPENRQRWQDSRPPEYTEGEWLYAIAKLRICLGTVETTEEKVAVILGWEKRRGLTKKQ